MKRGAVALLMLFMIAPLNSRSATMDNRPENRWMSSVMRSVNRNNDIDPQALRLALQGYWNLKRQGMIRRDGIVTLIDFNKPSDARRLFIIDVNHGKVLHSALVAHGRNSGDVFATSFSNRPGSNQSSIGFYLTANTYIGKNGYSLVLKGLDRGINDKAEMRSIVMHGADYVSEDYIQQNGRLGRSLGCPAVEMGMRFELIDQIKEGSCLFIYHNGTDYVSSSAVLNPELASRADQSRNPA
ncbi:MAG: murein L,D-transpeptidase catalytic domain family protein [Chlorobiaceae bacterium]|nr:murein L,D-transpeptidase catalytic domain family protein [Chlorobiaceae bacterium]